MAFLDLPGENSALSLAQLDWLTHEARQTVLYVSVQFHSHARTTCATLKWLLSLPIGKWSGRGSVGCRSICYDHHCMRKVRKFSRSS